MESWGTVIAAAMPAIFVLLGTWLTNRHQRALAKDEREATAENDKQQRELEREREAVRAEAERMSRVTDAFRRGVAIGARAEALAEEIRMARRSWPDPLDDRGHVPRRALIAEVVGDLGAVAADLFAIDPQLGREGLLYAERVRLALYEDAQSHNIVVGRESFEHRLVSWLDQRTPE